MKTIPVLSLGMGVESVAILLRWMEEPESRDGFDLEDLIVITAQTGDEYADTKRDMEAHILPRMRQHGIRYIQVARGGHLEEDGIVVLEDTRCPTVCHTQGHYKLSDELSAAGTVPQFGGEHRCSLKFKAFVIENWLETNIYDPIRHAFGYNAEEPKRIAKSETAIAARLAFGFNAEEPKRISKSAQYDHAQRIGWYPLRPEDWNWNREQCEAYIFAKLGIHWKKSACVYCPFAKLTPQMKQRHVDHPHDVAQALMLEYCSLCMNPRGTIFSGKSLMEITQESGNIFALKMFEEALHGQAWALYRVRRIYTAKGKAHREVRTIDNGTRKAMAGELDKLLGPHVIRKEFHGITYAYVNEREEGIYPTRECYYVAAPAKVQDKTRYGAEWFGLRWSEVVQ